MNKQWIPGILGIAAVAVMLLVTSGHDAGAKAHAAPEIKSIHAPTNTLVVTSTADSGVGTLRWALQTAVTSDTITFDQVVFPLASPVTITFTSGLPDIITDNVTIDGSSAGVILDGSGMPGGTTGLVIDGASNVTIKGLQILNFPEHGVELRNGASYNVIGGINGTPSGACSGECNLISGNDWDGVRVEGSGTAGNTVSGNYIGTDISGMRAVPNGVFGVAVASGASYNLIGGDSAEERNLISGNDNRGISISDSGTTNNSVSGNYIGVDVSGTAAIGNTSDGVYVGDGASNNLVGGSNSTPGGACTGECNLISSNSNIGVSFTGSDTMSNTVSGNYIGVDVNGSVSLGNFSNGVFIVDGAQHNIIGGTTAGERNLISGSSANQGIHIMGGHRNTIVGNFIGVGVSGTLALGNHSNGILVSDGAQQNIIGGDTSEERNILSGNNGDGVAIVGSGTMSNIVSGNYIGTNVSGAAALPNGGNGISIGNGASRNRIGGSNFTSGGVCTGECNLISGNGSGPGNVGVSIRDSGTMSNTVSGNYIGTDVYGTSALGNSMDGVGIGSGASRNVIGGDTVGERNLISGNGRDGADIGGAHNNAITGNYIGTDASGTVALGNVERGVGINDGGDGSPSTHNVVEGNLISGNGTNGVDVWGPATAYNTLKGNYIGTDFAGSAALRNAGSGVWIGGGASYNLIGGVNDTPDVGCGGDCNLISGNGDPYGHGIRIWDSGTMNNTVSGNYIGTDVGGTITVPNDSGVEIAFGPSYNVIGGDAPGEGNVISGNKWQAVYIPNAGSHNQIIGNIIGVDGYITVGQGSYAIVVAGGSPDTVIQNNLIKGNGGGMYVLDNPSFSQPPPPVERARIIDNIVANNGPYPGIILGSSGVLVQGNTVYGNANDGISVERGWAGDATGNTLTTNSVYSNTGQGISFTGGANNYMFPPILTEVSDLKVRGIAVPTSTVEIFSDDDDEGRWFHGSVTADASGRFTFTAAVPFTGTNVTATATDVDGNTSEFSSPYAPSRDTVIAAIYAPQTRQQINQPLTPLVRVGNGGTAPETFTVTAAITRASDGLLVYSDTQTIVDLQALHYRTLSFDAWTPTELGSYSFAVGLHRDTPDDDPTNDRLIQNFTVVDDRVDLWSRDNPTDDGSEPSVGPVWQSPDIWVRNTADGLTDHQNPINHITNTVYIRMHNRGTLTATNATVTAYWHPPALVIGQSWWESIGTVTVGELAPGTVYTASMPWQPQITGVLTEPYHTCLIDVISSTQDVAPTSWDVRGSNNIEQRNVDIVASPETMMLRAGSSTVVSTTFSVGNPYAGEQLVDVLLDTTGLPSGTEVRLDLRGLFERWQRFGQGSLTGATVISGTTQVMLSDEQAVIIGLPLMGEELFEVALEVSGLHGRQGQVDVSERIGGEVLGGISLQVMGYFEVYLPMVVASRAHGAVIIDSPWSSLPSGAGTGLAPDKEWEALTLQSDMTNLAFVLQPDPDKTARPNSVWDLGTHNGRLYLGYGDLLNNRGPVDIVSYDPLSDTLHREMLDIPEEQVGDWHTTADGQLYVGGQDSQESWTFGSFYANDGLGWQKRRTIYKGLHVGEVVDFQGRLYARYSTDGTSPVTYTFALVSDNQGVSWMYEPVDQDTVQYSMVLGIDTVYHATGEYLYAIFYVQPNGSGSSLVYRLYRFDGNVWEQVIISDPLGEFSPREILAFQEQMLVSGSVHNTETGRWGYAVYALDVQAQTKVAFLRDSYTWWDDCDVHDGWLYCTLQESPYDPAPAYILYRTADLHTWETVGTITLLPGARPRSLGFAHDRFYVGATNAGWWDEVPGVFELHPTKVYTIENATLHWDAQVPDGAQLSLRIRSTTAYSYSDIFDKSWVGPDGTENTAFTVSGEALHPQHNGDSTLQVAIYKTPNSSDESPLLRWITLQTSNGSVTLAVDEGPGLYTAVNSTDSAEYLSPVFRLQEPISGGNLFFEGATPPSTTLRFQVRSAPTQDQLTQQQFVGPDGAPIAFYQSSGQALWAGHSGDTCIQYRVMLASSDPTLAPFLRKVVLVTRSDGLDHFSIALDDSSPWVAGQSHPVTITAHLTDGRLVPIYGKVSLLAWDTSQTQALSLQPMELTLVNGAGTANISLQQAKPTQICTSLAGVTSCSPTLNVQPGAAATISVTTDLPKPYTNWSPVGQVGQPFTLTLAILDRYRNIVPTFTGTVRCERWHWAFEAQLFSPYTFQPSDQGYHQFPGAVVIEDSDEWNLVCFDQADPRIAGTQTVNIQAVGIIVGWRKAAR